MTFLSKHPKLVAILLSSGLLTAETDELVAASASRTAARPNASELSGSVPDDVLYQPIAHQGESGGLDTKTRLSASTRQVMRCPACTSSLVAWNEGLSCANISCARRYAVVDGIPILIDEARSLFDVADFVEHRPTTWPTRTRLTRLAVRFLPALSLNPRAEGNIDRFASLLPFRHEKQRVLIIGGRSPGQGTDRLLASDTIELVETDVAFGPRTALICDAHDLPFADGSFDGVVIQAVLQYVQDPVRVANEIHRVLGDGGLVYAEVPFVQHGLEGYDYNRFPTLGLRRLFRRFDEISAGPVVGPASTLSWSLQFFALSFVTGRVARAITKGTTRLVFFWVKYIDLALIGRSGAADAANELFFLGRRSTKTLSDRELARTHQKFR